MNRRLAIVGIVAMVLIALGMYWYMARSVPQQAAAMLTSDLYPLYSGATWSAAVATTSPDYGPVIIAQSETFTGSTDIAAVSTPFTKYYHDKLIATGWVPDMSREAGGPGAEVSVYTKAGEFVVVMFRSVFNVRHPDAPSECPCDVRLTLMSGTQVGPTPGEMQVLHEYDDNALHFSVTLPTALSLTPNASEWSADPRYEYTEQGPGKSISGVKFTIPTSLAAGTNLSSDSYISVEHLSAGAKCDAAAFMADPSAKSHLLKEGVLSYSVASSSDAAVGNRYEETVYARTDSDPCIAVRYFIHYGAIENYPPGAVKEFDKAALLEQFDQIRRTLRISQ